MKCLFYLKMKPPRYQISHNYEHTKASRLTYNCAHLRLNNKKNKNKLSKNGRRIEPCSLTKSDLTTFSPFQTISGKKKKNWPKNCRAPSPRPPNTTKRGVMVQKKVIRPIFLPFQTISGIKILLAKIFTSHPPSPSRFPCCVLSYFSLVVVMEHN